MTLRVTFTHGVEEEIARVRVLVADALSRISAGDDAIDSGDVERLIAAYQGLRAMQVKRG